MASNAAAPSPGIWRRGAHETSLVRLYVLRAVALFLAIDGIFTKLPYVTSPDPASRGIVACILVALWLSAFLVLRQPVRMMPVFLFELIWKTLWLLDYGAPQWLAGAGSPRLSRDLFEIGFFPLPIALILPWGHIWRCYVQRPAERSPDAIPGLRLHLLRGAFLVLAVAGSLAVLPGIIRPDPVARGMQESMLASLWLCALLGVRYPLQMLPILLFDLAWTSLWLADYGLPRMLPGGAAAQTLSDLPPIAGVFLLCALAIPWRHAWRVFVRGRGERWRCRQPTARLAVAPRRHYLPVPPAFRTDMQERPS